MLQKLHSHRPSCNTDTLQHMFAATCSACCFEGNNRCPGRRLVNNAEVVLIKCRRRREPSKQLCSSRCRWRPAAMQPAILCMLTSDISGSAGLTSALTAAAGAQPLAPAPVCAAGCSAGACTSVISSSSSSSPMSKQEAVTGLPQYLCMQVHGTAARVVAFVSLD